MKSIAIIAVVALLAACATFKNNQASEKLITQYAVMKVIEADKSSMPARAAEIRKIAGDAKSFFDTGTATVDQLAVEIAKRIAPLNLSPADRMLADALVQTVVDELKARAAQALPGAMPTDTVYQVSTVLGWVVDATAFYP